ncbi:putative high mobility group [Lyophyllum shimeji]|uniref:High mobility group n=1 Tax=Lyophyllum shimeji TaxID=47721 RepID=A0A9P3PWB7_LYOSH|nr:putative high mobility group [Lyophyllum shimeji]
MPPRAEKIPRPPNSFMLYRSDMGPRLPPPPPGTTRPQAEVSRLVAKLWHNEAPEVRREYMRRAAEKKKEHEAMYPDYTYKPRSKAEKEMEREARAAKKAQKAAARGGRMPSRDDASMLPPFYPPAPHASTSTSALQYAETESYCVTNETQRYVDPATGDVTGECPELGYYAFEQALQDVFGNPDFEIDYYTSQAPYAPPTLELETLRSWDSYYPSPDGFLASHASFNDTYDQHDGSGGRRGF